MMRISGLLSIPVVIKLKKYKELLFFILLFHFIFSISYAIPTIHLIGIFFLIYFFLKYSVKLSFDLDVFALYISGLVVISYGYCVAQLNSGDTQLAYTVLLRYFLFLLIPIIIDIILIRELNYDFDKIIRLIFWIIFAQAICVYLSVCSATFYNFVVSHLPNTSNIKDRLNFMQIRFRGFSNTGGDSLSLVISTGPCLAYYLLSRAMTTKSKVFYFSAFWAMFLANIFVGRTGIVVDLGFLVFIAIFLSKQSYKFVFGSVSTILLIAFIVSIFISQVFSAKLSIILNYAFDFILGDSASVNDVKNNMLFLPDTINTLLFGDGHFINQDGTNYMQTDSGYIRFIFYFGIVGSAIFYLSNLVFLLRVWFRMQIVNKSIFLYMALIYFFIEIKRPFIAGSGYTSILYLIYFFSLLMPQSRLNKVTI